MAHELPVTPRYGFSICFAGIAAGLLIAHWRWAATVTTYGFGIRRHYVMLIHRRAGGHHFVSPWYVAFGLFVPCR